MASSNNYILALLAASSAGILISFQTLAETSLKHTLKGGVFHTSVIAFGSAFIILVMYGLWKGLKIVPPWSELKILRGFEIWGGLIRILYLMLVVFACQRVGIAKATCVVIAAQLISATAFQTHGLFGAIPIAWSWQKGLGVALIIAGVVFSTKKW